MLKFEITPFAQAHRDNLDSVKELLIKVLEGTPHPTIEDGEFVSAINMLDTAKRGFDRFEACAHDEWGMKERALEKVRHCRLNHRDRD